MTEHHRKIELQSPDDLQYLISNVRRVARQMIDKDLPPMPGMDEDPMRQRVEELVQDYIRRVFLTTGENITINGMAPEPSMLEKMLLEEGSEQSVEEHEPFNAKLWERAKELARQEEEMIEEIASLRRSMPGIAVEGARKGEKVDDEETLGRWVEGVKKNDSGELGITGLDRQEQVEKDWSKGVEGLGRMKRGLPEMAARKERAEKVEAYVLSEAAR